MIDFLFDLIGDQLLLLLVTKKVEGEKKEKR